jgi:hypothetical protein
MQGLGIGIGYSGYVKVEEDNDDHKTFNPYYSGIDLRFAFTGIDKLSLTFNNNISFSAVTGETDTDKTIIGIGDSLGVGTLMASYGLGTGTLALPDDFSDAYFGMYNGLAVGYKLSDPLVARVEIGNRMGSYTLTMDDYKFETLYDKLRVVLSAAYTLNSHVGLEAGLAFQIDHASLAVDKSFTGGFGAFPGGDDEFKGGTFTFGIPLRLHVVF